MWQNNLDESLCVLGKTCNPELPNVLLVHGAGNTAESMRPLLEALSPHANVAALNLPGRAEGAAALEHIGELAAFVAGFITASGVKPWVLGHSLGAAMALETARKWPNLLSGLILVNASTSLPLSESFMGRLEQDVPATMDGFLRKAFGPKADAAIVDEGIAMVCSLPEETVKNDFKACRTYQVLPSYLRDIKMPVLILAGEDDVVTKLAEAQELHTHLPNAKLVTVPQMGHMGPTEAPGQVAHEVNNFMRFIAL